MRALLLIIIVCLLAAGCHHAAPALQKLADSTTKDTTTTTTSQKIAESFPDTKMVGDTDNDKDAGEGYERPWADTLISNYIKHTKNKLISFAVQHKLGESWEFDQLIKPILRFTSAIK